MIIKWIFFTAFRADRLQMVLIWIMWTLFDGMFWYFQNVLIGYLSKVKDEIHNSEICQDLMTLRFDAWKYYPAEPMQKYFAKIFLHISPCWVHVKQILSILLHWTYLKYSGEALWNLFLNAILCAGDEKGNQYKKTYQKLFGSLLAKIWALLKVPLNRAIAFALKISIQWWRSRRHHHHHFQMIVHHKHSWIIITGSFFPDVFFAETFSKPDMEYSGERLFLSCQKLIVLHFLPLMHSCDGRWYHHWSSNVLGRTKHPPFLLLIG